MSRRVWPIFLFELRAILSKRGYQIATVAFPLLGVIILGVIRLSSTGDGGGEQRMSGYVDLWGKLPRQVPAETRLQAFAGEEAARDALLAGDIDAYFVVPADYVQTGLVRQYQRSDSGVFRDRQASAVLGSLLVQSLIRDEVAPAVALRVQAPVRMVDTVLLDPSGQETPPDKDSFARFFVPYIFGILLLTSLMMSSGFLVQSVAEEKQTRTIEVLLSSVSSTTLMTGKILGLGAAGLVQIILWLTVARALAPMASEALGLPASLTVEPAFIIVGVVFFILGYLFYATILAGVGAMATTPQEGGQMAGLINMAAVVPFFLMTTIMAEPSGALARVMTYVPFTSPLTVMLRMSASEAPWLDIAGGMVVLVMAVVGALALSARVFHAYLLLYGQRPGLRDVVRTLRNAR